MKTPAKPRPLTTRQMLCAKIILDYHSNNGYWPLLSDVAEAMGGINRSGVAGHLKALKTKQILESVASRAFKILPLCTEIFSPMKGEKHVSGGRRSPGQLSPKLKPNRANRVDKNKAGE
jgi:SOS-response transcriptional repressor LexA